MAWIVVIAVAVAVAVAIAAMMVVVPAKALPAGVVRLPPGRADPEALQIEVFTSGVVVRVPHHEPVELRTEDAFVEYLAEVQTLMPQAASAEVRAEPRADATEVLALLRAAGFTNLRFASVELVRQEVAVRRSRRGR